jgi:hypothetical protein
MLSQSAVSQYSAVRSTPATWQPISAAGRGAADPGASIEHAVLCAHTGELAELRGRDPAERVEILKRHEVLR